MTRQPIRSGAQNGEPLRGVVELFGGVAAVCGPA